MKNPTRDEAWELLCRYTETVSLRNHGLAVEGVMRHFAGLYSEDTDKWGIIGLIHDLDWEKFPEEHCVKTGEILTEADWPAEWIKSVQSHGWGLVTEIEPELPMEKVLYAIDELTGLITAAALVRPSKSVLDLTVKSVKKKWKSPAFAAGANRDVIQQGVDMMGKELPWVIEQTIEGMKSVADAIGLGNG